MKKTEIKIRISEDDKEKFKKICEFRDTTMSDSLNAHIYEQINTSLVINDNKSIRVSLVKQLVNHILFELIFEPLSAIESKINNRLSEHLSFNAIVTNLEYKNGFTSGIVCFDLEDSTLYSITFTVFFKNGK